MKSQIFIAVISVVFLVASGCGGGGAKLQTGDIQGPATVNETGSAQYSINASGDSGITYQWACDPQSAGGFTNSTSATTTFNTALVDTDTQVVIQVTVTSDNDGPVVATINVTILNEPETAWVRMIGGTANDDVFCTAVDSSRNVYFGGAFGDTVDMDTSAGTDYHTSTGNNDAYILKVDEYGAFQWARTWGNDNGSSALGMTTDGSGNLYVTGWFYDTVDFDPGPGTLAITSGGGGDLYLVKFTSDGDVVWVKGIGGTANEYGYEVVVDLNDGSVYVTGEFDGSADFDTGPASAVLTTNGGSDTFITKFDQSGNLIWAKSWGGSGYDIPADAVLDNSGNIVVCGKMAGTVDFDPGPGVDNHTTFGDFDSYVTWLDSSGNYLGARTWGGQYADEANGVTSDASGIVYVAGFNEPTIGPVTDTQAFLSKFDAPGNLVWDISLDGTGTSLGFDVDTDSSGLIYLMGTFSEMIDFDPGTGTTTHTSNGYSDGFISQFNPDGSFVWTRIWGGNSFSSGSDIDVYELLIDENIHIAGSFRELVDFDPGPGDEVLVSTGNWNGYLLKLHPDGEF